MNTITKINGKDVHVHVLFNPNKYGSPVPVDVYKHKNGSFAIVKENEFMDARSDFFASSIYLQKQNQLLEPTMTKIKKMQMVAKNPSIAEETIFKYIQMNELTFEQACHELKVWTGRLTNHIFGRGSSHAWVHRKESNECLFRIYDESAGI